MQFIRNKCNPMWFSAKAYRFNIDFKSIQLRLIQYSSLSAETVWTELASHQLDLISIRVDRIQLKPNQSNSLQFRPRRFQIDSIHFYINSIQIYLITGNLNAAQLQMNSLSIQLGFHSTPSTRFNAVQLWSKYVSLNPVTTADQVD